LIKTLAKAGRGGKSWFRWFEWVFQMGVGGYGTRVCDLKSILSANATHFFFFFLCKAKRGQDMEIEKESPHGACLICGKKGKEQPLVRFLPV
jgi:hypothetical protein